MLTVQIKVIPAVLAAAAPLAEVVVETRRPAEPGTASSWHLWQPTVHQTDYEVVLIDAAADAAADVDVVVVAGWTAVQLQL